MYSAHLALCATLIIWSSEAVRPALEDVVDSTGKGKAYAVHLHQQGQLSQMAEPQPVYDAATVEGIEVKGPMQDELKTLLTELGGTVTQNLKTNQEMSMDVHDKIADWVTKARVLQGAHPQFANAAKNMDEKTQDHHAMLTNIIQRHFKWHGKPVKEGPLGEVSDHVDLQKFAEHEAQIERGGAVAEEALEHSAASSGSSAAVAEEALGQSAAASGSSAADASSSLSVGNTDSADSVHASALQSANAGDEATDAEATAHGAGAEDATSGSTISGGATSGDATSGGATNVGATTGGATSGGATTGGDTSERATSGDETSGDATSAGATSRGATSGGATSGAPR